MKEIKKYTTKERLILENNILSFSYWKKLVDPHIFVQNKAKSLLDAK